MTDFARRAYDHSFPFDPIIRSLLDLDAYKLLMGQILHELFPTVSVAWEVKNRTVSVKLAEEIDIKELKQQLDHARTLRFTQSELIWLQGQTFFGEEGIFKPAFIHVLKTFRLPGYVLNQNDNGQFELRFLGTAFEASMWEIYALAIMNELRSRAVLRKFNRSQLDIIYARAKVKLYAKLEKLNQVEGLLLSEFGTRRRHGFLWQEHCVLTACEVLGDKFVGTSNMLLAEQADQIPAGRRPGQHGQVDQDHSLGCQQHRTRRSTHHHHRPCQG